MGAIVFPLDEQRGQDLAADWIAAWNSRDLDAIMALYAPGVVFQTPTIITTLAIPDGRVEGAQALREHFARGLERLPDLRFALHEIFTGVSSLAIVYRWHDGTPVCEVHQYDDSGLIQTVQALYRELSL